MEEIADDTRLPLAPMEVMANCACGRLPGDSRTVAGYGLLGVAVEQPIGVEFRSIRRQMDRDNPILMAREPLFSRIALMSRVEVHYEKHRRLGLPQQPSREIDEDFACEALTKQMEIQTPGIGGGGDHDSQRL